MEDDMRKLEERLKSLDEQYNSIARKIMYERLSQFEYDQAIEALQEIEVKMIKLTLTSN